MARLPVPGSDQGTWGDVLNDFLAQVHNTDGTIKAGIVTEANLDTAAQAKLNNVGTVADGSITNVKFASATIAEDKLDSGVQTKLNQVAPVTSVSSKTGVVTLVKGDVGLGNVDNTSDAGKPVSTATQTALNGKEDAVNKDTDGTLAADSDIKFPSQKAVKTYVDSTVSTGTPDADATTKGKIQLTGDLGGTAASPTVPGLASKADTSALTAGLTSKADTSALTSGLANKVDTSTTVNGHALSSNVTVTKSDVGLGNVPNTDATDRANHTGTQSYTTISGLGTAANLNIASGTLASRPAAASVPADSLYYATDDNLGRISQVNSSGTAWVSVAPAIGDVSGRELGTVTLGANTTFAVGDSGTTKTILTKTVTCTGRPLIVYMYGSGAIGKTGDNMGGFITLDGSNVGLAYPSDLGVRVATADNQIVFWNTLAFRISAPAIGDHTITYSMRKPSMSGGVNTATGGDPTPLIPFGLYPLTMSIVEC